ncbi:copper transpport protein, partial [Kickxella alabastrina]
MDMPGHGDHGGHGGHGDGGARPMCAMNMSFNWSTENVCVLFDFWRINSTTSLAVSFALVFVLGYLYELARTRVRRWEQSMAPTGSILSSSPDAPL